MSLPGDSSFPGSVELADGFVRLLRHYLRVDGAPRRELYGRRRNPAAGEWLRAERWQRLVISSAVLGPYRVCNRPRRSRAGFGWQAEAPEPRCRNYLAARGSRRECNEHRPVRDRVPQLFETQRPLREAGL